MQEVRLKRKERPVTKASCSTWRSCEESLSVLGRGGTRQIWLPGGERVKEGNDGQGVTSSAIHWS